MINNSDRAIMKLAEIRTEWQEAVGNDSLIDVQGSVGLLLADVTLALEMTPDEQRKVLGRRLRHDFLMQLIK